MEGWRRLTAGMELNDLWAQFKMETGVSSRAYKQDMDRRAVNEGKSWRQPFKIAKTLFSSILNKLSPPRRIFLLITIVIAFLSIAGPQFLFQAACGSPGGTRKRKCRSYARAHYAGTRQIRRASSST
jgi:hypothetical protein